MSFVSGIQIIHAPAGALNNAGMGGGGTENTVVVKSMRINGKVYPYVSAQAYRYWLRRTLEGLEEHQWNHAPIFREKKVAYTDANPMKYCDDDLFGYMRAPGKKVEAADSRAEMVGHTPTKETITRVSPFRVGTLVAMSPGVTSDFGTMSRHEGDPVPHEHQFYRTSLKGMFSVDLGSAGVFTYQNRTGYLNLDDERIKLAADGNLEHDEIGKSYRLPNEERLRRVTTLLRAMPVVGGGAKQAIHYTDVSPAVVVVAVTEGGNNPFQYLIGGDPEGSAMPLLDAFREVGDIWGETIQSPLYIGWVNGYSDAGRVLLEENLEELGKHFPNGIEMAHPKKTMENLAAWLEKHPDALA